MLDVVEVASTVGEDLSEGVKLEGQQVAYVSLFGTTTDALDVQDAKVGELTLSTQTEIGTLVLTSGNPETDVDPALAMEWLARHRDLVDAEIAKLGAPAAE
jgi:hypothetical protein